MERRICTELAIKEEERLNEDGDDPDSYALLEWTEFTAKSIFPFTNFSLSIPFL